MNCSVAPAPQNSVVVASEICDLLDAKATAVYTACSFQDLTGQRTRKVIQVLRYLEGRINAMIDIWGLDGTMAAEAAAAARAREGEAALVNRPARDGHGLDQADVDIVMGPAASAAPAHDGEVVDAEPMPMPAPTSVSMSMGDNAVSKDSRVWAEYQARRKADQLDLSLPGGGVGSGYPGR